MNTHSSLISLYSQNIWALDPRYAVKRLPFISALLEGKLANADFVNKDNKVFSSVISAKSNFSTPGRTQSKIGLIHVKGELVKDSYWWFYGMNEMSDKVRLFDADPEVCGIILNVDSPGGTVDGTYAFAEVVKNTKKPIVVYSDGLIASAAYWISSAADYIICNNKTCEVGSIGVMMSFLDWIPYYEKSGAKYHMLVAEQSPDKNRLYQDVCAGKYEEYQKTVLNPLADEFISKVKSYRSGVNKKTLTGTVYFADKAIEMGLINEIGTFDRAIEKVLELTEQSEQNSQSNTSKNMSKKTYTHLSTHLGADHVFGEDGTHLAPDQLDVIETALAGNSKQADDLSAAQATITAQNSQIQSLEASIKEKDTQIANLQNDGGTGSASDRADAEVDAPEETLADFAKKNQGDISAILDRYKEENGLK